MTTTFLGFEQRPVELADKERLSAFLAEHPHELSGYTFAALHGWRDAFDYSWGIADGALLVSFALATGGERHLLQPVGDLRPATAAKLLREASALPYPLEVVGVDASFIEKNRAFADHFEVTPDRGMSNYIYKAKDLADLRGARFAKKRNLIAQAENSYSWSVEALRPEHSEACREVLHAAEDREGEPPAARASALAETAASTSSITTSTACATPTLLASGPMRSEEVAALELTLDDLAHLEQSGVLVRVEGQPAAFSIFERQSADTAVVHFERALRSRKGLYQVINRETARAAVAAGFTWLNREEDLDDPGLRQAKSSYHPARLADAFRLLHPANRSCQ